MTQNCRALDEYSMARRFAPDYGRFMLRLSSRELVFYNRPKPAIAYELQAWFDKNRRVYDTSCGRIPENKQ
jgi:hypothetical protein